jgi:hypothetical protein
MKRGTLVAMALAASTQLAGLTDSAAATSCSTTVVAALAEFLGSQAKDPSQTVVGPVDVIVDTAEDEGDLDGPAYLVWATVDGEKSRWSITVSEAEDGSCTVISQPEKMDASEAGEEGLL